jgi:hypothetical protein
MALLMFPVGSNEQKYQRAFVDLNLSEKPNRTEVERPAILSFQMTTKEVQVIRIATFHSVECHSIFQPGF